MIDSWVFQLRVQLQFGIQLVLVVVVEALPVAVAEVPVEVLVVQVPCGPVAGIGPGLGGLAFAAGAVGAAVACAGNGD